MAGIVGSLLCNMTKAGEPPVTSLVAIMIVTTASLLWCLSSWSGYSRRHFPYKVTIVTDLLFLLPFGVFSVLLGLLIHDGGTKCPRVKPKDGFTIQAGPLGVLDFSGEPNGRVSCTKLYLLWVLMLIVCASFVLSAASVGVITSQETQFNKALWCAREMGGPVGSGDYHRGSSQIAMAGLEEVVVAGSERQLQPRPRVHVSTRSLPPGRVSDDDDRRDGDTSYQSKPFGDPYRVNMTNRHGPRASRYDCTPRVDSSLGYGYGTSQGRSLGDEVLQGGNGKVNTYNRRSGGEQYPNPNQQQQQQYRVGGVVNNRELTTKPPLKSIPIPVLQARSAALDQLEGRSSASVDLADAPYYRDLYTYFAQPDPPDPDPDRDSWATFTNRHNPQEQTQRKWKKQRPSGLLFLPNWNVASSPTLHPDPNPDPALPRVESNPYSNTPSRPSQAQTHGHGHDSYTSSVYSSPSIYDDTRFDHRDLPSPDYGLCHLPRSSSGAAGVKYSLPPRPRTTLRLVDKETLNRLEGITEEEGGGDAVIELEDIPISPLPPAGRAPYKEAMF
ncbi:hypothetical protein N0V85_002005 [Neurospora sp. IMI 360204]|nr:hypothetical protein N0V85_002005 [Neurospora sp. IMI 360204]